MAGFSLIEVLMSILVLAIGLIGAAMMQLHAARTTEQSNFHDTALTLAMQIADEIRANDVEMRKYGAANPFSPFQYKVGDAIISASPNCYLASCSTAEMANHTKQQWQQRIRDVLPQGRVEICRDATVLIAGTDSFNWCSGIAAATAPLAVKIGWYERDPDGSSVQDTSPRIAVLVAPYSP